MNNIFDAGYIFQALPIIAAVLPGTLFILTASLLFGSLLGLLLTIVKLKAQPLFSAMAGVYISFMRGTPTLVQLFLVYYGLPKLLELAGININDWDKVIFAVITFSLHTAAFLAEVMRSAYLAVDRGQREAAYSVGMGGVQAFTRIILPQAFVIALPNLGNTVIAFLKETSLAFTIGVVDIMGQTQLLSTRGYGVRQLEVFIAVSLLYWAICLMIEKSISLLENHYKKGYREIAG